MNIRTDYITGGTLKITNLKLTKANQMTMEKTYEDTLGTLPTVTDYVHTFAGWYTEPSGGIQVTENTSVPLEDTTYYAHWTLNNYTLTVNPNGGVYNSSSSNSTYTGTFDSVQNIGISTPPSGYTVTFESNGGSTVSSQTSTKSFNGWTKGGTGQYVSPAAATTSNITRTAKNDGVETYENFAYSASAPTSNTWYYLRYPAYTYTSGHLYEIRYKARVNTFSDTSTNIQFRHSALSNDYGTSGLVTKSLSAVNTNWTSYNLYRTISGSTTTLNGSSVTVAPVFEMYTSNLNGKTISANFDLKDVAIIDRTTDGLLQSNAYLFWFRAGDGTLTANYKNNSITLPKPTKAGYVFDGWYTDSGLTSKAGAAGASYTPTTNITLYAKWQAANYEVSGTGKTTDYFLTLSEAHSYASAGNTVKVLQNVIDSGATISKNLTLNTNSKTLTMNGAISVSSGTLTITSPEDSPGTLKNYASGNQNIIYLNGGSTSLSYVTLSESGSTNTYDLISNAGSGSVILASVTATISTANSVVYCSSAATGAITINSGTYNANAKYVVRNLGSGTTTIAGGTLTVTSGTAIALTGSATLNVTGGTINNGSSGHAIIESGSGNINLSGGTLSGTSSSSSNVIYMSENSTGTLTVKGATIKSVSTTNYAISIKRDSGPSFSMTSGTLTCNASGGCLRGYHYDTGVDIGSFTISGGTISSSSGGVAGDDYLIGLAASGAENDKISGGVIANYATGGAINCSNGADDLCILRIQGGTMYAASNSGYGSVRVNYGIAYIGYSTARILAKSAYALYVLNEGNAYINYNSASGSGLAYNAGAVLLSTGAAAVYVTSNADNIVHLGTRTYAYKASDGSSVPAPRIITGSSSAYTIQCGSSATCTFRGGRTYANSTTVSHLNSGFTTYSNASGTYKTSTSASGTLSYGSGSYAVTASYKARGYYGT